MRIVHILGGAAFFLATTKDWTRRSPRVKGNAPRLKYALLGVDPKCSHSDSGYSD
jgi:hypothetical protein